jgi:Mrp family chromosome partitioning ATPase
MSRNFELLRQVQRSALLQRATPPTATNSRNFEVLRQGQIDEQLFESTAAPATVPTESAPPRSTGFSGGEPFKIVQRLFLASGAAAPRAVVFCAVEQGRERNWVCARVAELLAKHTQGSICIVDANLASPSLHTYFEVENRQGLAGAILEAGPVKDFTRSLGRGRLRLMSAGVLSPGADSSAVLASGRLRVRMSELRASFDYVVVDAAPAAGDTVTANLAALADGVILVVEPSFTPRRAALEAKEDIEAAGGRVLGVVLHRRGLPFPDRSRPHREP